MLIAILWPHKGKRIHDRIVSSHHRKAKNENANQNSPIPSNTPRSGLRY